MRVFIVGGTGLLGSAAAAELLSRGHEVSALALPPLPEGAVLPAGMRIELGNCLELGDAELERMLRGFDALVFAAGVDERVEFKPPVFKQYLKYNVLPVDRLLSACRAVGVRKALILGSYFTYYAKLRPELHLGAKHPYIRSRLAQEELAMGHNCPELEVLLLELPYIFGTQAGRKPVWTFLVESLLAMRGPCLYPRGGSAMVTVRQVGQAIAGALERGRGGRCYPLGYRNLEWREMLAIMYRRMGMPKKRIVTIPDFLFSLYARGKARDYRRRGLESGLDLGKLAELQCAKLFIDPGLAREELGVGEDDLEEAIGASVDLCLDSLRGKELLDMKAE